MKHFLNVCKVNGAEVDPVDIITFGSPCQDMSIAGKRKGIKHSEQGDDETTRSGLFYEAIRIIKEMRKATNGEYPKYAVWENVPGAFSSNKGWDFLAVLEALCSVCDGSISIPEPHDKKQPDKLVWLGAGEIVGDSFSICWRTLDAQYWGVPQRRKRIYLVADFTGRRAGEILFKPDSLRGDLSQSNEAGQGVAADAVGGIDGSSGVVGIDGYNFSITGDKSATVGVNCGMSTGRNGVIESVDGSSGNGGQLAATVISSYGTKWNGNAGAYNGENFVLHKQDVDGSVGVGINGDIAGTLDANYFKGCGLRQGVEREVVAYSFDSLSSNSMKSSNPFSGCRAVEIAKCIDTTYPDPSKNQGGIAVVQPLILKERAGCAGGGKGALWSDKAFTLATNQDMSVCVLNDQGGSPINVEQEEISQTLRANMGDNQPVIALQANGIDRADTAGCNGSGWRENEMYTLNTIDRHAVAFQLCGDRDNPSVSVSSEKSYIIPANPMSDRGQAVCYDARNHNAQDISGTIQAKSNGGQSLNYINPVCYDARGNGDGETVLFEPRSPDGEPRVYGDICPTLNTAQGGQRQPRIATPSKPPRKYIIRRLTPTECARLQGFPDWWSALAPYNPADAEFWEGVRKTHAEINGKKYKPVKDLKMWYDKLHNDGAEYKMWGNGIALPCAEYVLQGISEHGTKTLGSLFDGSGGFPLAGAINGIMPLWSSEVEPYPIAVTKSRFI